MANDSLNGKLRFAPPLDGVLSLKESRRRHRQIIDIEQTRPAFFMAVRRVRRIADGFACRARLRAEIEVAHPPQVEIALSNSAPTSWSSRSADDINCVQAFVHTTGQEKASSA